MNIFAQLKPAPFGLEQEYTFYQDFQIADKVGGQAGVLDTWKRVQHWQDNPQAWGELTCALNWRLWDLHETDEDTARLYQDLWTKAQKLGYRRCDNDKEYASVYLAVID